MPNNALDDVQLRLLEKGIIDINEEITPPLYSYVREAIMRLKAVGSPDITIYITSPGGNVALALDIYDLLRLYTGQVVGAALCQASSAAVVILQGCNRRQCARHAGVLIHQTWQNIKLADISEEQVETTRQVFRGADALMEAILCARTGKTVEEIRTACLKEEQMSAEEALAFGLIDEII